MDKLKLSDKELTISIPSANIQKRIEELARQINKDLDGQRPVFVGVLNGSFMFTADLMKKVTIDCEIAFIRVSSYFGTASTGVVKSSIGLTMDIKDRTIVLVEDIIDTGTTINYLLEELKQQKPKQLRIATLLFKPAMMQYNLKLDYVGFEVGNDFLVGYGLDYNGSGRNLNDIYKIES